MDVLIFLIPIAIDYGLLGLFAFNGLKSGQYDDLEGAKWRILETTICPPAGPTKPAAHRNERA